MTKEQAQQRAIEIVKKEVEAYRDPIVFITDKVAFAIKPLIRQVRKNYWGVFDEPNDKITGRKKIWVPLTQMIVDNTRKNVDLDTKDINFYSNIAGKTGATRLLRAFIRPYLDRTHYGEDMDDVTFNVCVDPVSIMKVWNVTQHGKNTTKREIIDPLNIFIDPEAKSIQEAYRFTYKTLMSKDTVAAMTGWMNKEKAQARTHSRDMQYPRASHLSTVKAVGVFEMWGKVPKSLITLNEADENDEIDVQIVVSDIENEPILHVFKENKETDTEGNIIKPFEDTRYMKVPWSFYGISPAMKVMDIQEWINTIVNLRINKNTVAQLGLFKVRAGSNINTQSLARLVSNGVIKVTNMDDIDNFEIPEAGPGSYKDEETAKFWATEVTSAYDIVRGSLPSTTTATAAVIQDKNSKSSFVIVRDALGRFNEKVIQRHMLKYLPKMMKDQKVIRFVSDMDEFTAVVEDVVAFYAMEALEKSAVVPTEIQLQVAMEKARKKLMKNGDLFVEMVAQMGIEGIETRVQVTNEKMDTATLARNLTELVQFVPPEAQMELISQTLDVLGVSIPKGLNAARAEQQAQGQPGVQMADEFGQFLEANTAQNAGGGGIR